MQSTEFFGVILTILLIDIIGRVKTQGTLYLCGGFAKVGLCFSNYICPDGADVHDGILLI